MRSMEWSNISCHFASNIKMCNPVLSDDVIMLVWADAIELF